MTSTPTPKFAPEQRVHTHECQVATVVKVDTIAPPYQHGVTGEWCPTEVWYVVRRPNGSTAIISELHLRAA
jgi:hypothetical protein